MPRLLLNSEATNINGATKPCQRPSQNPATTLRSLTVPLNRLASGAHPAKMFSNSRTRTTMVNEDFIAIPPSQVTQRGTGKSQGLLRGCLQGRKRGIHRGTFA